MSNVIIDQTGAKVTSNSVATIQPLSHAGQREGFKTYLEQQLIAQGHFKFTPKEKRELASQYFNGNIKNQAINELKKQIAMIETGTCKVTIKKDETKGRTTTTTTEHKDVEKVTLNAHQKALKSLLNKGYKILDEVTGEPVTIESIK